MAINIYSGNSGGAQKRVNSAAQSTRAKAAKAALGNQAAGVSDSGSTAVGSSGVLGKVGNFVGKAAGIASKFLPGIGGTIAKGLSNIFNDPEWWQSVPGEQITCNVPQRVVGQGTSYVNADDQDVPISCIRPAIVEFAAAIPVSSQPETYAIFTPDEQMITQYLMPEIRKVVNAVPLQSASAYSTVLRCTATVYAMWRQLKKCDYILKHGMTYMPNLNVASFPIFQVTNAAWLQSTINRVEEFLRASVRLPHTLCEYLAWRFGRAYRSCDSARAGLVCYDVLALDDSIDNWNTKLQQFMARISATEEFQKANTDIYNAYYDHDMFVEIGDDTQCLYDPKEFALRTNLDVTERDRNSLVPVFIDSKLDNPTVFMASTVSTYGKNTAGNVVTLFPVREMAFYVYSDRNYDTWFRATSGPAMASVTFLHAGWNNIKYGATYGEQDNLNLLNLGVNSDATLPGGTQALFYALRKLALLKSADVYNKGVYLRAVYGASDPHYFDLSQLNMDMGMVDGLVLSNEHVFAFANMVHMGRKRSMSRAMAEKAIASDVANTVEKLDLATAK